MQGKANTPRKNSERVILFLVAITALLAALGGCQGLPRNVANCPITPVAPANTGVVPPAPVPPPAALFAASH